jgi:hypothetical protein
MAKHNTVFNLEEAVGRKSGEMYPYLALEVRR